MHIDNSTGWTVLAFLGWSAVFYCYHSLGITLGYHRMLTHHSLKVPKWLEYAIVSGGYLAWMGAPIPWVAVHRLHHQKSDQQGDPHSPRDGFIHALCGWMLEADKYQSTEELRKQVPDLLQDPVYCFFGTEHHIRQVQVCLAWCVAYRLLVLLLFGWVAFAALMLFTFVVFWGTQLVNSVCHLDSAGYRSQETREASRNVWWVALLTMGEGWHNNHHAMPKSARHGLSWWEVDGTYITICILEKLGLASAVNHPPKLAMSQAVSTVEEAG